MTYYVCGSPDCRIFGFPNLLDGETLKHYVLLCNLTYLIPDPFVVRVVKEDLTFPYCESRIPSQSSLAWRERECFTAVGRVECMKSSGKRGSEGDVERGFCIDCRSSDTVIPFYCFARREVRRHD